MTNRCFFFIRVNDDNFSANFLISWATVYFGTYKSPAIYRSNSQASHDGKTNVIFCLSVYLSPPSPQCQTGARLEKISGAAALTTSSRTRAEVSSAESEEKLSSDAFGSIDIFLCVKPQRRDDFVLPAQIIIRRRTRIV
jgi:hypothetical protein